MILDAYRCPMHSPPDVTIQRCSVFTFHDRPGALGLRLQSEGLVTYIDLAQLEYAIDEARRAQHSVPSGDEDRP